MLPSRTPPHPEKRRHFTLFTYLNFEDLLIRKCVHRIGVTGTWNEILKASYDLAARGLIVAYKFGALEPEPLPVAKPN